MASAGRLDAEVFIEIFHDRVLDPLLRPPSRAYRSRACPAVVGYEPTTAGQAVVLRNCWFREDARQTVELDVSVDWRFYPTCTRALPREGRLLCPHPRSTNSRRRRQL